MVTDGGGTNRERVYNEKAVTGGGRGEGGVREREG